MRTSRRTRARYGASGAVSVVHDLNMLPTVAMPLLEAVAMACIDLKASCVTEKPPSHNSNSIVSATPCSLAALHDSTCTRAAHVGLPPVALAWRAEKTTWLY